MVSLGLATILASAAESTNESSASSSAFVSRDPIVLQARALMAAGNFKQAESLLTAWTQSSNRETARDRTEMLEVIRRTRYDYSLDEKGLAAKVREVIPNATDAEVARWADESRVRFRIIDGRKFFFRREPRNIFIFSPEAIRRRAEAGNEPPKGHWKLIDHLQTVIDDAERTGQTEVVPVRHKITYTLTITNNAPGIKAGALVRAWLPYPQEYRQQKDVKLMEASPEPRLIAPNAMEGDSIRGAKQRTIYFEQKIVDPAKPIEFKVVFEYVCSAYYPKLDESLVQPLPPDWGSACLGERPPHIVFTPEMRATVAGIIGQETNSLAKAKKIFRWVNGHVRWNAEDEYGTIPSLCLKGFTAQRGDCGVQNTVFITLCRIAGIPARWQSGYETKPFPSGGMHDWSEIYIAPWGWVPTDASYGVQASKDPRIADFFCGHQDSYRMIINLDWGQELFPPKESMRSEPADFQRGEVEIDGKNLYYDEWTSVMKIEHDPEPNAL